MGRIDALTSIRFFAVLAVFIHHWLWLGGYAYWGDNARVIWENRLTAWGWELRYGVTLFFVLSGFLLAARYFDTIFSKVSLKEYWVKRFARIFPLYWTLLTILLGVYIVQGLDLKNFVIYYTLTQSFFSDLKFTGLGTAWSLTVEECFYLTLPFVIVSVRWMWKGKINNDILRYVITGAILMGFVIAFYQMGRILRSMDITDYGGFMGSGTDVRLYTIFGRFFDFAIGIIFGVLYAKTRNVLLTKKWIPDLAIAGATIGVLGILYLISINDGFESRTGYRLNQLNAVLSAVIIYFLCAGGSVIAKLMTWRPFVYGGEISFAFYLIHANYMIDPFYYWIRDLELPMVGSLLITFTVPTILAVLAYEAVERPAQYYILSRYFQRDDFRRPSVVRLIFGKKPRSKAKYVLVPQPTGLGGAPMEPMPIEEAVATGAPQAGKLEDGPDDDKNDPAAGYDSKKRH